MVDYASTVEVFEVAPGEALGPFRIGMTGPEAAAAAEAVGLTFERSNVRALSGGETWIVEDQLFVYLDHEGRVDEIEAATQRGRPVTFDGLRLDSPAREVAAVFDAVSVPDRSDPEFPATICYPGIGLCLWMDAGSDGPVGGVFESVLVRRAQVTFALDD